MWAAILNIFLNLDVLDLHIYSKLAQIIAPYFIDITETSSMECLYLEKQKTGIPPRLTYTVCIFGQKLYYNLTGQPSFEYCNMI